MDYALQKLADFERNWGGLFRWLASIVFLAGVWGLVHFGDAHYIQRTEFRAYSDDNAAALREINGKLDSVIVGLATTTQHAIDIEKRLDDERQRRAISGPEGVAAQ